MVVQEKLHVADELNHLTTEQFCHSRLCLREFIDAVILIIVLPIDRK